MIQDVGNIELCELLETEPKTQCTACLSYWNTGMICCTCGHFLHKETGVNRKLVKYTMDLLSVPEYVIKKVRPHGHRYGKKPANDWKSSRRRSLSTNGMVLRMKITLTIWPHKNTSTIRANGGFIQISKVLILCHWGIDLISSRHCLPYNDCNKKQEKNHRQAPTMGGTQVIFYTVELARFMVDSLSFRKSRRRCTKYWVNGTTRCLQYLAKFFGKRHSWIQLILLQIDRLQLTAVYCNRLGV